MLNRQQILDADDLRLTEADAPEWGGTVFLRIMSGTERDAFEQLYIAEGQGFANFRARLLVRCLCDAEGKRLFEDGDADALGAKSASAISPLYDVAARLNGITGADVDELVGNS